MNIFSSNGPAGVGAAYASFCMVTSLIRHLEKSGAVIPADVKAILDNALNQIPSDNIAALKDARRLIEDFRK